MEKRKNSALHKWGPGSFSIEDKVFSWSVYNVWRNYGPNEFTKKYLMSGADQMNPRMMTGRIVADMIESDQEQRDPTLEHLRVWLPRYETQEYEIEVPFNGLTLVMHLDGFDLPKRCECSPTHAALGCDFHIASENNGRYGKIGEYKTGVLWNREKVEKWKQLDWYVLGVHLKFKVPPEKIPIVLTWMPTIWKDGESMPRPTGEIENFETRRSMRDMLNIGKDIMVAWREIETHCAKENPF